MWPFSFYCGYGQQSWTAAHRRDKLKMATYVESGGTRVGSFDAAPRKFRRVCKNGAYLRVRYISYLVTKCHVSTCIIPGLAATCQCRFRHVDLLLEATWLSPRSSTALEGNSTYHRVRVHKIGFTMLMEGSFGSDAFFEQLF